MLDYWMRANEHIYDQTVKTWLQLWFLPASLMGQGTEIEQWMSRFSLNGIKQATICGNRS